MTRRPHAEPQARSEKGDLTQQADPEPEEADRLRYTAARLRNMLDQKTGREKQVLKAYLVVLERRLARKHA